MNHRRLLREMFDAAVGAASPALCVPKHLPDPPKGRTVVVATQRFSTVSVADRAVVIADGRIAEQGLPADLLGAGGPFAALFGDELVAA